MTPIIYGKSHKSKTIVVFTLLCYIVGILNLIIAITIMSKSQAPTSSTIIITSNGSGAIINHNEIINYLIMLLGAVVLVFGIIFSISLSKHKNDHIYVYNYNVKLKSTGKDKEIDFSDIIECSLIEERKRKLFGDTIILKTKYSQQVYRLFNIDNAEKIVETINKTILDK